MIVFLPFKSLLRPLNAALLGSFFLVVLSACQNTRPDPKIFDASPEHLQRKTNTNAQVAPIPTVSNQIPYLPKPRAKKYNDLYTVSVVQAPVKDVLFKLARDAGLDIDVMDNTDGLITLNALDQTLPAIIERLNEQTGLRITLMSNRLVVQADKPYWVNYPIDYVNLERFSQSTVLLANAVGSRAGASGGTAVSLGASSGVQQAASLQAGSNVAILNRSQHELWKTLGTGIMRTLRAMYPTLGAPLQEGESGGASTARGDGTNSSTTTSAESSPTVAGLVLNPVNALPAPEQPFSQPAAFTPYPEGTPVSNYVTLVREAGFVAVYAPEKGHKEVQKYIDQMMAGGRRQVMVEATVVEIELNDESQSGVNWSALTSDASFGLSQSYKGTSTLQDTAGLVSVTGSSITQNWSLASALKLLERYGNSRVLSSPKMVGINNQPTLLKVVKNLVYFMVQAQVTPATNGVAGTRAYTTSPTTVPIGLVMSVLPSISENDEITLVVRPTISTLDSWVPDPNPDLGTIQNLIPIIQEREMESVLKLNDGQIAILGGLIQDTIATEDTGVPGLVGQSITGYLFGQKSKAKHKSELVIFLKPVLIKHPDIENGNFADKRALLPQFNGRNVSGRNQ
jgi:general secretion pathway protein D